MYNPNQVYTFICKSQKLAGYLMLFKGFKLHEVKPSREDRNRNVYLFTNSPEIHEAIKEYQEWRNTNNNGKSNKSTNNIQTTSQRTTNTFKE